MYDEYSNPLLSLNFFKGLENLGLSTSLNGESLSFSYTIIHKKFILSDSIKKGWYKDHSK